MKKRLMVVMVILTALFASVAFAACGGSDADVASENLSKAAEQFEVPRRVVFYNGITDKYMLTIEGFCSIEDEGANLEVTCKDGDHKFKKDYLGLSDNVTYVVEQLEDLDVSTTHYRVIFKPETIIPDFDRP
jgi:FlaG/FlaF family flagellin (archaellin)